MQALTAEERDLKHEIEALVGQLAPALLDQPGVGPIAAAQVLISLVTPRPLPLRRRLRPTRRRRPDPRLLRPVRRHRLDPGSDRQLNRALHTIIVSRRKTHAPTISYIERKTREGKTVREAIRCLKRYLARHLFRLLEAGPMTA